MQLQGDNIQNQRPIDKVRELINSVVRFQIAVSAIKKIYLLNPNVVLYY
jgi:hypothetical protein